MPSLLSSGRLGHMNSGMIRTYTHPIPIHTPTTYAQTVYTQPTCHSAQIVYTQPTCHSEQPSHTCHEESHQSNKCDGSIDKNSALFFNTLASKLLEMSKTIEDRIEDIKKNCNTERARGCILVSIDTPHMNISVGAEYFIYVQRHGPPIDGKFDPEKLALIRAEENIEAPS
jgi:hypothetical protein